MDPRMMDRRRSLAQDNRSMDRRLNCLKVIPNLSRLKTKTTHLEAVVNYSGAVAMTSLSRQCHSMDCTQDFVPLFRPRTAVTTVRFCFAARAPQHSP